VLFECIDQIYERETGEIKYSGKKKCYFAINFEELCTLVCKKKFEN
tara:strand:+ start:146 stop:283 length:138 start_codon:yes stop_codon:yes gene_type:complete